MPVRGLSKFTSEKKSMSVKKSRPTREVAKEEYVPIATGALVPTGAVLRTAPTSWQCSLGSNAKQTKSQVDLVNYAENQAATTQQRRRCRAGWALPRWRWFVRLWNIYYNKARVAALTVHAFIVFHFFCWCCFELPNLSPDANVRIHRKGREGKGREGNTSSFVASRLPLTSSSPAPNLVALSLCGWRGYQNMLGENSASPRVPQLIKASAHH